MTKLRAQRGNRAQYASLLACVLSCALLCACLAAPAAWADVRSSDVISGGTVDERGFATALCPSIEANHALLVDDTGKIYFERAAHEAAQVASITKVMTALVALDYDPGLSTTVRVTEEAAAIGESSAMLLEGDTLDMKNALTAMMVASGNDAAESIAASIGAAMLVEEGHPGASDELCVQRFVKAMNDKAAELGLEDTVFTNPHGLDDGEYAGDLHSTAADVAVEVKHAMENQVFRGIVGSPTATVKVKRDGETVDIDLTSTDELLEVYEGTVGVKTGTTDSAGACFAGANNRGEREYYAIVLDSTDEYQRFLDTQALWDWCYGHWREYPLVHAPESVEATIDELTRSYPILARVSHTDWMDKTVPATIANPDATVKVFELDGNISQQVEYETISGRVKTGDKVGSIRFVQRNETLLTVDLVAAQDVDAPDPLTAIGIWWQRLWGNNDVAESVLLNTTPALIDKTQTTAG